MYAFRNAFGSGDAAQIQRWIQTRTLRRNHLRQIVDNEKHHLLHVLHWNGHFSLARDLITHFCITDTDLFIDACALALPETYLSFLRNTIPMSYIGWLACAERAIFSLQPGVLRFVASTASLRMENIWRETVCFCGPHMPTHLSITKIFVRHLHFADTDLRRNDGCFLRTLCANGDLPSLRYLMQRFALTRKDFEQSDALDAAAVARRDVLLAYLADQFGPDWICDILSQPYIRLARRIRFADRCFSDTRLANAGAPS